MVVLNKMIQYKNFINRCVLQEPLFYNNEYALRFEFASKHGGDDKTIFNFLNIMFSELFTSGTVVFFKDMSKTYDEGAVSVSRFLKKNSAIMWKENYFYKSEDPSIESCAMTRYVWETSSDNVKWGKITHSLFPRKAKDLKDYLFYILDPINQIAVDIYDDRGLDVAFCDKNVMQKIYYKFSDWICEYDRKKIISTLTNSKN